MRAMDCLNRLLGKHGFESVLTCARLLPCSGADDMAIKKAYVETGLADAGCLRTMPPYLFGAYCPDGMRPPCCLPGRR